MRHADAFASPKAESTTHGFQSIEGLSKLLLAMMAIEICAYIVVDLVLGFAGFGCLALVLQPLINLPI